MTRTCLLLISLLASVLLTPTTAKAFPPTGRIIEGTLRDIDRKENTAIVDGTARKLIKLTPRTVIFKDGVEIAPSELRNGMRVKVFRHVPVFGPPFATRVIVQGPASK